MWRWSAFLNYITMATNAHSAFGLFYMFEDCLKDTNSCIWLGVIFLRGETKSSAFICKLRDDCPVYLLFKNSTTLKSDRPLSQGRGFPFSVMMYFLSFMMHLKTASSTRMMYFIIIPFFPKCFPPQVEWRKRISRQ